MPSAPFSSGLTAERMRHRFRMKSSAVSVEQWTATFNGSLDKDGLTQAIVLARRGPEPTTT
jgi:hypothetical protein